MKKPSTTRPKVARPRLSRTAKIAQEIVAKLREQGRTAVSYTHGDDMPLPDLVKPVLNDFRVFPPDALTQTANGCLVWVKIIKAGARLTKEQQAARKHLDECRVLVCVVSTQWEFFNEFDWLNPAPPTTR